MNRKIRYWIIEATVVSVVLVMLFIYMFPKFLAAQNINTPENFPDPVFRRKVELFMGVNRGGKFTLSEAAKKEGMLDCSPNERSPTPNGVIKSVQGIEFFQNITTLKCDRNKLTELDLSCNSGLKHLICARNSLVYLNITNNKELEFLSCDDNKLKELNVKNNSKLKGLICSSNLLSKLDISHNTDLEDLGISDNPMQNLDLTGLLKLQQLYCDFLSISTLDLTRHPELIVLYCRFNRLKNLNLSRNPRLKLLLCEGNELNSLDLNNNPELETIVCRNNRIVSLDLHHLSKLKHLDVYNNCLSDIPILNPNNNPTLLDLRMNNFNTDDVPDIEELKRKVEIPVQFTDDFLLQKGVLTKREILKEGFVFVEQQKEFIFEDVKND